MPYIVALVVLVALLGLLNLVLTLGVIRRLRSHGAQLSGLVANNLPDELMIRAAGEHPGEFTATTTDGGTVSHQFTAPATLVAFFQPNCPGCTDELPKFLRYAAEFPGGREAVIAVISGEEQAAEYVDSLTPVARVVVEKVLGPVQNAFRAMGYPAFAVVVDGVVAQSAHRVSELPPPGPNAYPVPRADALTAARS